MEKIHIKNFGGLTDAEFEFGSINVLIGPQASGKSMVVKLLYYFKGFFSEFFESTIQKNSDDWIKQKQLQKFKTYFPRESWSKGEFKIIYSLHSHTITISRHKDDKLTFNYSDFFKVPNELLDELDFLTQNPIPADQDIQKIIESADKIEHKKQEIRSNYFHHLSGSSKPVSFIQLFLPAGRSIFANIQNNIFSFLKENQSIDPFLIQFGSLYEVYKNFYNHNFNDQSTPNEEEYIISEILNGVYNFSNGIDYLIHRDGRKVNLSSASSGQQEILPLTIIVRSLFKLTDLEDERVLFIEEPEAHLFPTAQKRIVQLLARLFNTKERQFQIFITTHSPYILSSFNNLLQAGKTISENPDKKQEVFKVIPESEVLLPESFFAYSLAKGIQTRLLDEETKLIPQSALDGVSDELAIEFGKLLDIEFD